MQVFSIVFCEVRAAHKFDSKLVLNENLTTGEEWKQGHTVIETRVFDRIYTVSADHRSEYYGPLPTLCGSTAFSRVSDSRMSCNFRKVTNLQGPACVWKTVPSTFYTTFRTFSRVSLKHTRWSVVL